jgi:hypothetical protein
MMHEPCSKGDKGHSEIVILQPSPFQSSDLSLSEHPNYFLATQSNLPLTGRRPALQQAIP